MTHIRKNAICYTLPFLTWIGLQTLLPATAWAYAVRTLLTCCTGLVCWWLMGQGHTDFKCSIRRWTWGILLGGGVCVLWIVPDYSAWYRMWCCWPIGSLPPEPKTLPYDPATCGWALTLVKLFGSAFVIAPVEEVFFRSFLYRWLQNADFKRVQLAHFDFSAFAWMVFLFTLEHDRPIVAALAGITYGLAAIRWGLSTAIIAHITTNLALGIYVIHGAHWAFW